MLEVCFRHVHLLRRRRFSATIHVKASINGRFCINAYVFSTFLLYEYSWSWLAADLTSRRPSGCVLKNFLKFEIQPTLGIRSPVKTGPDLKLAIS